MRLWLIWAGLAPLFALAQGLPAQSFLIMQQVMTNDPDQSLVYVTGKVRKLPDSATGENSSTPRLLTPRFTLPGAPATLDTSDLIPAVGVEVRFWQPDQPSVVKLVHTDADGDYVVGLSEGEWLGEACGSVSGFYPAAWRLSIDGNKLVSMQAIEQPAIEIDALTPTDLFEQGDEVTLHGRGFGCNGSVLISYSNPVDRCGYAQPVEYGHDIIRISDFVTRSDTLLRFQLPELSADRGNSISRHIASLRYVRGHRLSPAVAIGERINPFFTADNPICRAQRPVAAQPSVPVITDDTGQPVVGGQQTATVDGVEVVESEPAPSGALDATDVAVETQVQASAGRGFSNSRVRVAPLKRGGRR